MSSRLRAPLETLLSPLMLAAFAAWAAVWWAGAASLSQRDPMFGWLVDGLMLLFLAGFLIVALLDDRRHRARIWAGVAMMAGSGFGILVVIGPSGTSPILLVLLAGVLASLLDARPLTVALVAVNLGLLAIAFWHWGVAPSRLVALIAAFGSFQVFAAVVMLNARRAEQMAARLREVNAELLGTRSLLEHGTRDAERLRLSRELHDVAGHSLTALKLNLGALARDPRQPDPERIRLCAGLADELLQNLRDVVRQMRDQRGFDLPQAIARLSAPFPTPQLHLEVEPGIELERVEVAEAILRTVQEGLTNAARHSGADNLWVVLLREGRQLRLELRDDGRGVGRLQPGNGLSGMRERLQALGGDLAIDDGDRGGLRLHAWLPCAAPA